MKLARASEMQELDRNVIEKHFIPGMVLMENAGRGTFVFMTDVLGSPAGKSALLFIGPGNNGGDGLVIARCIRQAGGFPFLIFLVNPENLKGDAAHNFRIVNQLDFPSLIVEQEKDLEIACREIEKNIAAGLPWAIVDAVFGTGLQRPVAGMFLSAIHLINRLRREQTIPVVAVDIPSGLNSDTGQPLGASVRADLTATYGLAKPGHFMHGGNGIGRLRVIDIGIPDKAAAAASINGESLDHTILDTLNRRKKAAHKGNFGHLFILAGSEGKTGAAILCALGALRSGAGLVSLGVPGKLNPIFESALIEAMTIPLPQSEKFFTAADADFIMEQVQGKSALIMGPGMGTEKETAELVVRLYRTAEIPMVIDADALNILATVREAVVDPPGPRILTPHPGEMARLTGLSAKTIQADRLNTACSYVDAVNGAGKNVTLILKGAGTIICDPAGTWAVNSTGNPGMAAGGMGDVLAGLIAGLLAQGIEPPAAARIGVYLHGLAADRLAEKREFGYLASEVASAIPALMTEFIRQQRK
ncbi:MAG: NAD(P)H-hydrate dehydratase [Desulfobulbaceae bacterium]|nr:NAD(P)H-hydrate dehydratase [Desulfobulbaceae bacterium]